MRKSRFTDEQMVAILREADREPTGAVAKRHGLSEQTIYTWRKRFGTFQADDVRRLKQLESRERAAEEAGRRARSRDRSDEGDRRKKMVSVPARRAAVAYAMGRGLSQRRACTLLGVGRSALHYCSTKLAKDTPVLSADGGAFGAVSALRLSADRDLPWPGRSRDELRTCVPLVAARTAAGAAQASEKAHRDRAAAPERAERREPGVVVRLRVRLVRQRPAAQVPDRHRRVDQGGSCDRGRRPHPLRPRDRGVVAARVASAARRFICARTMGRNSSRARC